MRLFRDPETTDQMGADDRDVGLAMYAGHVHGAIAYTDLEDKSRTQTGRGLLGTTAIFRGVHRPMIEPELDGKVYAYVTTPRSTFVCPVERHKLRLGPLEAPMPKNAVFVTFVLFDDAAVRRWDREIRDAHGENVDGIIIDWEWTLADPDHPDLPDDCSSRYDERKW